MRRRALVVILSSAAFCALSTRAQYKDECREGTGDLGIGEYVCNGGDCSVSTRLKDGRVVHQFSIEPHVTAIDPNGPSVGKLQERDVRVAIDGRLVTTFEGGYRLANAKIGVAVKLRIRRDKKELEVTVLPGKGCNLPRITVVH